MNVIPDDYTRVNLSLSAELACQLDSVSKATRIPISGVIEYLLEGSDLPCLVHAIHERQASGYYLPTLKPIKRVGAKSRPLIKAYFDLLRPPAKSDTYDRGNYV